MNSKKGKKAHTCSYGKRSDAELPQEAQQITMQVERRSDVLIRGKSDEVLRVANMLKNAI